MSQDKIGVMFVCLGNICRSPSAQGIFEHKVSQANLSHNFAIDSTGTAAFNVGKSPDTRALEATTKYGYNIEAQIARQIQQNDFNDFQYIIPMDRKNLMTLNGWKPSEYSGEIKLFMEYHPNNMGNLQIPDPYHDGIEAFYPIIETIEKAAEGLLSHIRNKHQL